MDEDDLPPQQHEPDEPTTADSLGQIFGSMIWIVALFAIGGGVVLLAIRYLH
jgi:hypothetical protein